MLTIAAWVAKAAAGATGIGEALARFFNVNTLIALVVSLALVLVAAGGASLASWWRGPVLTAEQADKRTEAALDAAALDAERAVLAAERAAVQRQRAELDARAKAQVDAQAQIDDFMRQLEGDRTNGEMDRAAAVRADDEWLRAWQRRGR